MTNLGCTDQLVEFALDGRRYALRLTEVMRIVRVADVAPLPQAQAGVLGVINIQGRIIPVIDIRQRVNLPEREVALSDHLLIAHTQDRELALIADAVVGVVGCSEQDMTEADLILPDLTGFAGVAKFPDRLVFLLDAAALLPPATEPDAVLAGLEPGGAS